MSQTSFCRVVYFRAMQYESTALHRFATDKLHVIDSQPINYMVQLYLKAAERQYEIRSMTFSHWWDIHPLVKILVKEKLKQKTFLMKKPIHAFSLSKKQKHRLHSLIDKLSTTWNCHLSKWLSITKSHRCEKVIDERNSSATSFLVWL